MAKKVIPSIKKPAKVTLVAGKHTRTEEQIEAQPPKRFFKPGIVLKDGIPYFKQADLEFPIDGRDLSRTVGAGPYGYGNGIIDQLSDKTWIKLLQLNGLPSEPLVREIARPAVMRVVQRAYFEHYEPRKMADPAFAERMAERDAAAFEKYRRDHVAGADVVKERKTRAAANLNGHGFAKREYVYKPTKATPKSKDVKGQQQLIAKWFEKNPKGGTCQQVTAALVAGGFTCNQDPARAIYYYLNEWKKVGKLEAEG